MKKIKVKSKLLSGILLLFILSVSAGCIEMIRGVRGNGNVVTQQIGVKSFDAIKVGGSFEVYLNQADTESLKIEADENLMDLISARVRDNTLIITTREQIRDAKALKVYITFKDLRKMNFSGAVEVTGMNKLNFNDLSFHASGASEVELNIAAKGLEMDLSGASEIDIKGYVKDVNMDISGAVDLSAYELETDNFNIEISGAAKARINVNKKLDARISGAGSLRYKGNPNLKTRVSGAGSIRNI